MGVTKKQQVEKSLASDVSVNSDVTLEKISAKEEPDDYVCQTCGKNYKKRKGNFSPYFFSYVTPLASSSAITALN